MFFRNARCQKVPRVPALVGIVHVQVDAEPLCEHNAISTGIDHVIIYSEQHDVLLDHFVEVDTDSGSIKAAQAPSPDVLTLLTSSAAYGWSGYTQGGFQSPSLRPFGIASSRFVGIDKPRLPKVFPYDGELRVHHIAEGANGR